MSTIHNLDVKWNTNLVTTKSSKNCDNPSVDFQFQFNNSFALLSLITFIYGLRKLRLIWQIHAIIVIMFVFIWH